MICCVQRVKQASVSVNGVERAGCGKGLLVFIGVEKGDGEREVRWTCEKITSMRVFEDEGGKMSLSVSDINGEILAVSQFTLAADCSRGRRPDFGRAEIPAAAETVYEAVVKGFENLLGPRRVSAGVFGAHMEIKLINDGPATFITEKRYGS